MNIQSFHPNNHEILQEIFSYLSPKDLANTSLVYTVFRQIVLTTEGLLDRSLRQYFENPSSFRKPINPRSSSNVDKVYHSANGRLNPVLQSDSNSEVKPSTGRRSAIMEMINSYQLPELLFEGTQELQSALLREDFEALESLLHSFDKVDASVLQCALVFRAPPEIIGQILCKRDAVTPNLFSDALESQTDPQTLRLLHLAGAHLYESHFEFITAEGIQWLKHCALEVPELTAYLENYEKWKAGLPKEFVPKTKLDCLFDKNFSNRAEIAMIGRVSLEAVQKLMESNIVFDSNSLFIALHTQIAPEILTLLIRQGATLAKEQVQYLSLSKIQLLLKTAESPELISFLKKLEKKRIKYEKTDDLPSKSSSIYKRLENLINSLVNSSDGISEAVVEGAPIETIKLLLKQVDVVGSNVLLWALACRKDFEYIKLIVRKSFINPETFHAAVELHSDPQVIRLLQIAGGTLEKEQMAAMTVEGLRWLEICAAEFPELQSQLEEIEKWKQSLKDPHNPLTQFEVLKKYKDKIDVSLADFVNIALAIQAPYEAFELLINAGAHLGSDSLNFALKNRQDPKILNLFAQANSKLTKEQLAQMPLALIRELRERPSNPSELSIYLKKLLRKKKKALLVKKAGEAVQSKPKGEEPTLYGAVRNGANAAQLASLIKDGFKVDSSCIFAALLSGAPSEVFRLLKNAGAKIDIHHLREALNLRSEPAVVEELLKASGQIVNEPLVNYALNIQVNEEIISLLLQHMQE